MEVETTPAAETQTEAPAVAAAPVPEAAAPKVDDRKADIRAAVERAKVAQPTPDAPPIGETAEAKAQRLRDEKGRFAEAPKPTATAVPPAAKPATPQTAPAAPELRPPADWKPAAREKWGSLPREIQEETLRTHIESRKALSESTQARQFAEGVKQTLTPYQQMLGQNPIQAMDGILRTAHQLSIATPSDKAAIIANLVRGYNIPIDALAAAIEGGPAPTQQVAQQQQAPQFDPQTIVAQVRQQLQQEQQQGQLAGQIETFKSDPKNEFFNDVWPAMTGLIRGGLASSLEDAYKKACSLDPSIAAALKQREDSKAAIARQATTQAARAAASSLRSTPLGPSRPEAPRAGDDRLADLRRSAAKLRT